MLVVMSSGQLDIQAQSSESSGLAQVCWAALEVREASTVELQKVDEKGQMSKTGASGLSCLTLYCFPFALNFSSPGKH